MVGVHRDDQGAGPASSAQVHRDAALAEEAGRLGLCAHRGSDGEAQGQLLGLVAVEEGAAREGVGGNCSLGLCKGLAGHPSQQVLVRQDCGRQFAGCLCERLPHP